jgi:hypothetical protein
MLRCSFQVHHKPALAARLAQLARALVYREGPEAAAAADEEGRFVRLWPAAPREAAVVVRAGETVELTLLVGRSAARAGAARLLAPTPYCYEVNETGQRFGGSVVGDADGGAGPAGVCCDRAVFTLHRRGSTGPQLSDAVACAAAVHSGALVLTFSARQWGGDVAANAAEALDGSMLHYAWMEWPPCLVYGHNGLPMPPFALRVRAVPSQPGRLVLADATEDAQILAELAAHAAPLE